MKGWFMKALAILAIIFGSLILGSERCPVSPIKRPDIKRSQSPKSATPKEYYFHHPKGQIVSPK